MKKALALAISFILVLLSSITFAGSWELKGGDANWSDTDDLSQLSLHLFQCDEEGEFVQIYFKDMRKETDVLNNIALFIAGFAFGGFVAAILVLIFQEQKIRNFRETAVLLGFAEYEKAECEEIKWKRPSTKFSTNLKTQK